MARLGGKVMKRIFFLLTILTLALAWAGTATSATIYVYQTSGQGPIDFLAMVSLPNNTGVVTSAAPISFENLSAPLDAGARFLMLGGTVTPTTITHTGFELDYPPQPSPFAGNDTQVFNEMVNATWTIQTTPEPSSLALLFVGCAALALGWRTIRVPLLAKLRPNRSAGSVH